MSYRTFWGMNRGMVLQLLTMNIGRLVESIRIFEQREDGGKEGGYTRTQFTEVWSIFSTSWLMQRGVKIIVWFLLGVYITGHEIQDLGSLTIPIFLRTGVSILFYVFLLLYVMFLTLSHSKLHVKCRCVC